MAYGNGDGGAPLDRPFDRLCRWIMPEFIGAGIVYSLVMLLNPIIWRIKGHRISVWLCLLLMLGGAAWLQQIELRILTGFWQWRPRHWVRPLTPWTRVTSNPIDTAQ